MPGKTGHFLLRREGDSNVPLKHIETSYKNILYDLYTSFLKNLCVE